MTTEYDSNSSLPDSVDAGDCETTRPAIERSRAVPALRRAIAAVASVLRGFAGPALEAS